MANKKLVEAAQTILDNKEEVKVYGEYGGLSEEKMNNFFDNLSCILDAAKK